MSGTRFPEGAASWAVLIGTGTFHDPALPDIPAVQANLDALRRTLTHPVHGVLAPEHCVVVDDPKDQNSVGAALSRAVRESEDLLLVYYCGHGLLDDAGLLHFALTGTDTENVGFSAVHLDLVKRMVGGARAKARVLVLDCCFSGQAVSAMAGPSGLALGQLNLTGTYTLTSTTATAPSHAPPGAAHTAFTGAMLHALTVPGPLTLDEVHLHIDRELAGLGLPRPQRRSVGAVGELSLVRGPVRDTETPSAAGTQAPPDADTGSATAPATPRRRRSRTVLAAIALSAVALLSSLWGNPLTSDSDAGSRGDSSGRGSSLFDDDTVQVGMRVDRLETGHYRPPEGGFSAYSVDVLLDLLKEARIKSEPIYVNVPWDRQISELAKRAVDLDAALTITPSRMREVDFVGPFASSAQGVLVRATNMQSIQKIGDLNGKHVCVQRGSTSADALKKSAYREIALRVEPDFSSCIDSVRNMEVHALAADSLALSALAEEHGDQLVVVPDISFGAPVDYGVALPKGHSKDCERLRDAMVKYVSSDTWLRKFQNRLPTAYERGMDETRPTAQKIKALSCRRTL
ncbi:caspase, EACC1-associated type [Streptomyces aureocirculatus]|uniref:caspase, EACC1-associated type n=1 Tax=Streptomyces aureocirculatus TaxID=67275 RepID=UPI00056C13EE|nr:transporter substrate-binding domain-containing protein [Streptomyces aureocirculatus]